MTTTTKHAVVIAGGGPTGLMLAGELALARVDVAIVERREGQDLAGSRAGGLHSRTIEVLDQRGIADRFLSQGKVMQVGGFAMIPLDISDFPTRHNYGLALPQEGIERTLATWVDELAVPIYRGLEVIGFAQDDTGVHVELSDGRSLRAKYLVGCDGGRSLIRKKAGIDFPGWDPSISYLIAEGAMTEEPAWGIRRDDRGINGLGKLEDGKRVRVLLNGPHVRQGDEPSDQPTLDDLREALIAVYGTDYGVHNVTWLSRFTDAARQAASYRERRVLLAGDAAHVHSPAGGQGLNIGVQDAVNLGWKLAQVVNGTSPERLLDETALFLHRVVTALPHEKQRMLDRLNSSDDDLVGRTVLLVDDDARNIFALSSVLERRGMHVLTATTGREAIAMVESTPDLALVLMDIMMPEMDGYQTMQAIRAKPAFRRLPMIALTAKAMKGDREKCLEAGASDYLAKPVNTEQLLSSLRMWLHR